MEYEINGVWWAAARSVNNQWPYHRELGDFSFPLPIRITSVAGEVITDVVPAATGTPLPFLSPSCCSLLSCCALAFDVVELRGHNMQHVPVII